MSAVAANQLVCSSEVAKTAHQSSKARTRSPVGQACQSPREDVDAVVPKKSHYLALTVTRRKGKKFRLPLASHQTEVWIELAPLGQLLLK